MKNYIKIAVIGILALTACKKAELKKPVEVNFALAISDNGINNNLQFIKGEISLSNFDITGDRIEGDDISFMRSFQNELSSDLNGSGEISELDYDLPQGEYTSILLDFSTPSDLSAPTFSLEGKYIGDTENIDFRFEVNETEKFIIQGESDDGSGIIKLEKGLSKKVNVEFNAGYWFENIDVSTWMAADITVEGNKDVIIINPTNNIGIYTEVVQRMTLENKAIFKN